MSVTKEEQEQAHAVTLFLQRGLEVYQMMHPATSRAALSMGLMHAMAVEIFTVKTPELRKAVMDSTCTYMQKLLDELESKGMLEIEGGRK